jgi:methyltransferase
MVNPAAGELILGIGIYAAAVRVLELMLAERNRRIAFSKHGQEFGKEHYKLFFILHFSWFCCWITESSLRGVLAETWLLWLTLFFAAQLLKCWAIFSLGECWNTRIIIVPGRSFVRLGPYRFLRHPNYLAVAAELFCIPMIFSAWITATVFAVLNAWLLLRVRIPAEEKAMNINNKGVLTNYNNA